MAGGLVGRQVVAGFDWPANRSLVDACPAQMGIRDISHLLASVGFASPPSWLRPFRALSNGEQFRVTMARALAEAAQSPDLDHCVVIDEFTSVVDRTVARIGSAAIAKAIRRRNQRFVAVTCHYDVCDWLDPDWVYEPASDTFQWRCERLGRPSIPVAVWRVHHSAWRIFKRHHYLSGELNRAAKCFVGFVDDVPALFTAVLPFPHPIRSGWREHRTVCLPDFQGVGLGNAMSEFVAGVFRATGKPYFSTTSNPAMIRHRSRSGLWKLKRTPSLAGGSRRNGSAVSRKLRRTAALNRLTAGFEFVGPALPIDARRLGVVSNSTGTRSSEKPGEACA